MVRRALRVGVSLVLMVILLAWFLRGARFEEMLQHMREANGWWLLAGAGIAMAAYWMRVLRWQFILRPVGLARHSSALLATAVGYAAIALLPARIGDLLRPLILARRDRLPVSASLASIVTERIFDMWSVMLYFLFFVLWPPAGLNSNSTSELSLLTMAGWVVGAGMVTGTLFLLALLRFRQRFVDLVTRPMKRWLPRWHEPVVNFLHHFLDGLEVVRRPRDLMITTVLSLFTWYLIYWQLKVTLLGFAIDLPLRATFFVVAASVIGLAVPTPGGMGGFHKAVEMSLGLFVAGASTQVVKSFVIAHHAICFGPITIIGLLCLPALGLSFGEVRAMTAEKEPAPS